MISLRFRTVVLVVGLVALAGCRKPPPVSPQPEPGDPGRPEEDPGFMPDTSQRDTEPDLVPNQPEPPAEPPIGDPADPGIIPGS